MDFDDVSDLPTGSGSEGLFDFVFFCRPFVYHTAVNIVLCSKHVYASGRVCLLHACVCFWRGTRDRYSCFEIVALPLETLAVTPPYRWKLQPSTMLVGMIADEKWKRIQ